MSKEPGQNGKPKPGFQNFTSITELVESENPGRKAPQYIAGLTASLAALSMGTTLAWTSQISENLTNGELGFPINKSQLGWIGSLMSLGAAALSLFVGSLSDLMGRKLIMLILIIPATIGWCLLIWPQNVAMLYCGRFITGMVAGSFCVMSLIYCSEIAQKEIRGALGSYTQLMISVGIFFANLVAKYLNVRDFTITCAAIPLVFGVLFVFMPESPVYLIKKEKISQARRALIWLRGRKYDVDREIKEIEASLMESQSQSGFATIKECLKKPSSQKACIIGFGLMIFKSANGMDAVTTYTSMIFDSTNMSLNSKTGTVILNSVQVATAIVQSLVVDRSGRRILLWLSASIMSVCLTLVGVALILQDHISADAYSYVAFLPLLALIIYTIAFSLGLGPIPWLMMGEIFPQEIKSIAASTATFVSWLAAFAITKVFPMIEHAWGPEYGFFIFAICTAVAVVFTLWLVPETKNKTFDEIQQSLSKKR